MITVFGNFFLVYSKLKLRFGICCKKTDMVGTIIEKWIEKRIGKVLFCNLCKKDVNYDKGGINQVNMCCHWNTKKHGRLYNQIQIFRQHSKQLTAIFNYPNCWIYVIKAEILWLFKVAEEDWSFASCDYLEKLFARMFKGCNVAEKFGVGNTKASYC